MGIRSVFCRFAKAPLSTVCGAGGAWLSFWGGLSAGTPLDGGLFSWIAFCTVLGGGLAATGFACKKLWQIFNTVVEKEELKIKEKQAQALKDQQQGNMTGPLMIPSPLDRTFTGVTPVTVPQQ